MSRVACRAEKFRLKEHPFTCKSSKKLLKLRYTLSGFLDIVRRLPINLYITGKIISCLNDGARYFCKVDVVIEIPAQLFATKQVPQFFNSPLTSFIIL